MKIKCQNKNCKGIGGNSDYYQFSEKATIENEYLCDSDGKRFDKIKTVTKKVYICISCMTVAERTKL